MSANTIRRFGRSSGSSESGRRKDVAPGALPRIAVSMGDPAGVGPEIAVLAHASPEIFSLCRPVVYGDREILARAAEVTGKRVEIAAGGEPSFGRLLVKPVSSLRPA